MKIDIVTIYQPFTNFGSFLQAYALFLFLTKEGHSVRFVKVESHCRSALKMMTTINPKRAFIHRVLKAGYALWDLYKLKYVSYKIWERDMPDCIIYGSDEIWNITNKYFCRPLFWGCHLPQIPKVGYALSAGHATISDFKDHKEYIASIKKFSRILIRDKHTRTLLSQLVGISTEYAVDPTLLIDLHHLSAPIAIPKKKYILVYTYGVDGHIMKIIQEFAKKYELCIISPCFWHSWADRTIACSALQLSSLMDGAEYVFTSTFHGAIFALANHCQCAILPVREKVRSLCIDLHESNRLITDGCSLEEFENVIFQNFDSTDFENNLQSLRIKSIEKLNISLQNI